MANQIKGKYIKNNAIDGSKILMLNDEPLRALKVDGTQESLLKLNGSDQLVLLKMPTVSADAVDGNELVRKSQVDAVASGLQSSINAEKARIDAILDAADADKDTLLKSLPLSTPLILPTTALCSLRPVKQPGLSRRSNRSSKC